MENIKQEVKKYIIKCSTSNKPKKSTDNTKKINALNRKLEKLKELYINDLIDIDSYKKDYEKYNKELKQISNIQNNTPKNLTNVKELLNLDIVKIYSNLTKPEKKKFWISLINKIYIENGEIKEITFL